MWYVKDNKKFIWNKEEQYSKEKRKTSNKYTKYLPKSEYKRLTNVWTDIPEATTGNLKNKEKIHLTPKPLKAIERIIKAHTKENDIVLDCFVGSGTVAIACKKNKRNFIGFELNYNCFNLAQQNIESIKN